MLRCFTSKIRHRNNGHWDQFYGTIPTNVEGNLIRPFARTTDHALSQHHDILVLGLNDRPKLVRVDHVVETCLCCLRSLVKVIISHAPDYE